MSNRICDRSGCGNPATWAPGFRIYPKSGSRYADSVTGLAICDECKKKLKLHDLLTDEGWYAIVEAFISHGKVRPYRGRTELCFTLLEDIPGALKPKGFMN